MGPVESERHPAGYQWRDRFPDARRILRGEGEAFHIAASEERWWLIRDSGTLGDPELGAAIRLDRFESESCLARFVGRLTAERTAVVAGLMIESAAARTARQLETRAQRAGLRTITERRDLRPCAESVLGSTRPMIADPLRVAAEGPHGLGGIWPCLGPVDLTLTASYQLPAFIELKCGAASDALGPCAWDLVKLAVALDAGGTAAGFLVGATTAAQWEKPIRGAEFLTTGVWTAAELREAFADWWIHWERDGRRRGCARGYRPPDSIPSRVATQEVLRSQAFRVGDTDWELRASQVEVTDRSPFSWPPLSP